VRIIDRSSLHDCDVIYFSSTVQGFSHQSGDSTALTPQSVIFCENPMRNQY
jgi:hypothetical protein